MDGVGIGEAAPIFGERLRRRTWIAAATQVERIGIARRSDARAADGAAPGRTSASSPCANAMSVRRKCSPVGMMSRTERARTRSRMVERQPIGAAPAAIMADDGEALEAERAHDRDLIARHGALRVGLVIGRWSAASSCRRSRAGRRRRPCKSPPERGATGAT